ncbi:MAG TPA: circadian clock protein KaiC [Polyangiaceae bacterium]|nr:circadian clock protein KaiC [Polyangiaceae bacterium]
MATFELVLPAHILQSPCAMDATGHAVGVEKTPSGISGFDQITDGGLPKGRATLVCGGPGSGKTIFAAEFLVRGTELGEPGVFVTFEESVFDLTRNVASLGFDLERLQAEKKVALDYIHLDPSEIEEAGGYSLDGLFVRLDHAIATIGAKRIAIDTLEVLFGGLSDHTTLRAEIQRLFRWLKEKGLTTVVTAEAGEHTLTRQGLEEYVSDCVVVLNQNVVEQAATRYLRVIKYRGSAHGTNEYPFLIDNTGFSVMPSTSLQLDYAVSNERVSSGIPNLDNMLGSGFLRASTILVSGGAGTGKSIIAAHFANASCERGERCMTFAFEESPSQIERNMRSVGLDLSQWQRKGLLQIRATRPSFFGLEMHLVAMHKAIAAFQPRAVILDPISSFMSAGTAHQVKAMLVRLFDWLKTQGVTGLVTYLTDANRREETDVGISSLIDTWLEVRDLEIAGERNRTLYLIKSRGMSHSNQVREFLISSKGVSLADVYFGPEGVLLGSAKAVETRRRARESRIAREEIERKERMLELSRRMLEAKILALRAGHAAEEEETQRSILQARENAKHVEEDREKLAQSRTDPGGDNGATEGI